MNTDRPFDFLTADDLTGVGNDIRDLLADTHLSVAITYKKFVTKTLTPSTGAYTSTYTDFAIRAVRNELSAREVAAGAGQYQMGDVHFMLSASDYSATPHREDRIVFGSDTYEVRAWFSDPLSKLWDVVARRVA